LKDNLVYFSIYLSLITRLTLYAGQWNSRTTARKFCNPAAKMGNDLNEHYETLYTEHTSQVKPLEVPITPLPNQADWPANML